MWGLNGGRVTLAGAVSIIAGAKCLVPSKTERRQLRSALGQGQLRVAVVGAGVGGSSAAYFLRQLCGDQLDLHVFEKAVIGGRTDVIQFDGHGYESGGAVFHSSNKYMVDFAQRFGTFSHRYYSSATIISMVQYLYTCNVHKLRIRI